MFNFDSIGSKLKKIAETISVLGIIASIILGIGCIIFRLVALGILTMLIGSLISWLGCLGLYGFGQLIENSDVCANYFHNLESNRKIIKDEAKREIERTIWQKVGRSRVKCPQCGNECSISYLNASGQCSYCGKEYNATEDLIK